MEAPANFAKPSLSVNFAEKLAFELIENIQESPSLLYNLAIISLSKGYKKTAQIFLNNLKTMPHLNPEMKQLFTLPNKTQHEAVKRLQALKGDTDFIYYFQYKEEDILKKLLNRNKSNKMAFEYLMANYLLTLQLDKISENIHYLEAFNYEQIPIHYQEAILMHMNNNRTQVNLYNYQISQRTFNRFKKFLNIHYQNRTDLNKAEQVLMPEFGNSYFYYYAFGYSGVGQ